MSERLKKYFYHRVFQAHTKPVGSTKKHRGAFIL